MSNGMSLIDAERDRQKGPLNYTADHDAGHAEELAIAAACYAAQAHRRASGAPFVEEAPFVWPWGPRYWKPTPQDRVRELVKAGALIAAAIDALLAEGCSA